jgi:hypothetical protein
MWTADEARMVKHILNNLTVKQWNLPSTEVERDLSGDWTIWIPEGGSGEGAWSGFVWYLGELKWDFSKVDADPDGEALEGGLGAALEGIYLVIELETGDFQWADSVSGIEGVSASTHSFFPVCARSGSGTEEDPYTYALSSNRVVGDIRIEAVPYLPVAEAEET